MKNKRFQQSQLSIYAFLHGKYADGNERARYEWAFDRMRLYESSMDRIKLRHRHISKVSLTANQLKGIDHGK